MPIPKKILKAMQAHPPFYRKVWLACARIPKGEVRTYGWIAAQVQRPGAARAVGTALAKNPFAPIIPCHRVIRSDGSLGGYSAKGGLKTKKKLLAKERARGGPTKV